MRSLPTADDISMLKQYVKGSQAQSRRGGWLKAGDEQQEWVDSHVRGHSKSFDGFVSLLGDKSSGLNCSSGKITRRNSLH
jgi:hypothetical protein